METRQAGHVGRDMKQNSDEITIDLLDVCGVIRAHFKTILLSTIICGVIAYLGTNFLIVPKYKAEAKLYVLSQSSDSEQLTTNDVAVGTSLVSDFAQVIKGQPVLNKVISNLGLNMSYEELSEEVSVDVPINTRIITITVTNKDATAATKIVDEVTSVSAEFIGTNMTHEKPTIIQNGITNNHPVNINTRRNSLIGALLGFLLASAVSVLGFYINDKILTPEDVEEKLGLSVLGTLPFDKGILQEKSNVGRKTKTTTGRRPVASPKQPQQRQKHVQNISGAPVQKAQNVATKQVAPAAKQTNPTTKSQND